MPSLRNTAKFGPIAALLRKAMAEKGLDAISLASHFPNPTACRTNISYWLLAKGAPGPRYRGKLAEILDLEPEQLRAKQPSTASQPSTALVVTKTPPPKAAPVTKSDPGEVNISVSPDGTITIIARFARK
jgi:hypothetical protein